MEFKTTFWMDFSIADRFGKDAVKDTYRRAFAEWKDNVEYLTELSIVLNWKIWQHWENNRKDFAALYDEMWREVHSYAHDTLTGDDLTYYWRMTD